ncbi:unnamed protein product [Psylliodes chrysocephalus]|uniref:Uncharacterized protein n=1 Tax=Psylliodes chrysocephalus TaxID=3402493 RepID=A0A9P0D5K2_9CUCU|nr:unnamed protein product [Psylliodes chrysocephala]
MNSLTVLLFCAGVIAAVNGAVLNPAVAQYQQFSKECISSTNTDPKNIAKVFNGDPIEVEELGSHLLCMNNKFNIFTENGDIDQDNLRKILLVFNPSKDKTDVAVTNS